MDKHNIIIIIVLSCAMCVCTMYVHTAYARCWLILYNVFMYQCPAEVGCGDFSKNLVGDFSRSCRVCSFQSITYFSYVVDVIVI